MRQIDIEDRLHGLRWADRPKAIRAALQRGFLARTLDPILRVRVIYRTTEPYRPRGAVGIVTPPRTFVNGSMTEAMPPDVPVPGRPGENDFKQYMRKYAHG